MFKIKLLLCYVSEFVNIFVCLKPFLGNSCINTNSLKNSSVPVTLTL